MLFPSLVHALELKNFIALLARSLPVHSVELKTIAPLLTLFHFSSHCLGLSNVELDLHQYNTANFVSSKG